MAKSTAIATPRLRLVPFGEGHISPRYLGWLNDPALMRYSEQRHRTHSEKSCREYLRSFEGTPNYFWAVEAHGEGLGHIGNMNAHVDERYLLADMGIVIGQRKAHGGGYALEAWRAVSEFLFAVVGIRKITAGALASNVPMVKLMERAGMVADGVRRRHYVCEGKETDIVHMALFARPGNAASKNGKR